MKKHRLKNNDWWQVLLLFGLIIFGIWIICHQPSYRSKYEYIKPYYDDLVHKRDTSFYGYRDSMIEVNKKWLENNK